MNYSHAKGPAKLPEDPVTIKDMKEAIKALTAYCRMLTPINTPAISFEMQTNGTIPKLPEQFINDERYHFKIEQAGPTSIKVHGGSWTHNSARIALETAGAIYSGTVTLTGVTTTSYVLLTLDSPYYPTYLRASIVTDISTEAPYPYKRVIGKITCSNSVITDVEQFWMGDIKSNAIPDSMGGTGSRNASISPAQSGRLQLNSFDNVIADGSQTTTPQANACVVMRDTDNWITGPHRVIYLNKTNFLTWLSS